jgi:hypothetical protein
MFSLLRLSFLPICESHSSDVSLDPTSNTTADLLYELLCVLYDWYPRPDANLVIQSDPAMADQFQDW